MKNIKWLKMILLTGIIWVLILIIMTYLDYFDLVMSKSTGKGDVMVYLILIESALVTWYMHTLRN